MRRLAPFLFVLLVAPADAAGPEVRIPDRPEALRFAGRLFAIPQAEAHRLASGVTVYIVEDHTLPLVDVAVAVRAGDFLDPEEKVGLASLTGALLRRGGTLSSAPDAFDEQIDFLGAEIDSAGGSVRSGAALGCASSRFPEALNLFFEMLAAPRFEESRLALAKTNLRESLARRNDDPLRVLDREWGFLLHGPEHFTTRQVLPRHLESITRQDLIDFHRRFYRPEGMKVAVSGDVSTADVLARLERHFAAWPPAAAAPVSSPATEPRIEPRPGLYHAEHETPQAKISLGQLGPVRRSWDDPESFALLVMNEVLGGSGTVSRLRARLRAELGLVYRARSSFDSGLPGTPGEFQIFLETDGKNAARVIVLTLEEVRKLRDQPVPDTELAFAKKNLTDGFPLLFDDAAEVAGRFAEDDLLGRPHSYWETYRDRIARVTAADVQRAARQYLRPERMVVLTVGRWSEIARGAQADRIDLEKLTGKVNRLPARDPLTLAPRP